MPNFKDRESDRRVILRNAPLPGGVGPTQTHLYMHGTKLMGQMYNEPAVPIIDFAAIPATVPPGAISPYVGDLAPDGWGLCDGGDYNAYDYRLLHSLIGNKFGGAVYVPGLTDVPGSEYTFKVPNFKGRMLMMTDASASHASSIGATGGHNERPPLVEHTHEVDQSEANIDSDTEILDIAGAADSVTPAEGETAVELWGAEGPDPIPAQFNGDYGHQMYPITTFGEVGLGGSLSLSTEGDPIPDGDTRNLPPYVCVNYVIRLV